MYNTSMIYHGKKQVAVAGTAEALFAVSQKANFVTFLPAKSDGSANSGAVRIGGAFVNPATGALSYPTAIAAGYGYSLTAGGAAVAWPASSTNCYDLSQIRIDADNAGDGVQFIWGTV